MKVKTVCPGTVYYKDTVGWTYNIVLNGKVYGGAEGYESASAAKQAMREEVYTIKRRQGLTKAHK